jgi:hypothetical protein
VLADVPTAPVTLIRKVQELSTTTSLAVEFDALPAVSFNGLTPLSYSLEIDFDLSGNYIPQIGFTTDQLGLTHF